MKERKYGMTKRQRKWQESYISIPNLVAVFHGTILRCAKLPSSKRRNMHYSSQSHTGGRDGFTFSAEMYTAPYDLVRTETNYKLGSIKLFERLVYKV